MVLAVDIIEFNFASGTVAINMEALLGAGGFPPILDIPPDADDETMVELAIALSLQDHEGAANLQSITHGLANLHNLAGPALQVPNCAAQNLIALPKIKSKVTKAIDSLTYVSTLRLPLY